MRRDTFHRQQARENRSVIQQDSVICESQTRHDFADRRQELRLDDERRRSDRIDIALEELAESPARGAIRTPDRLNLIPLEELRQLVLILRDDPRQWNSQVVAQR